MNSIEGEARKILESYKKLIIKLYQNDSINPCQELFQKTEQKYDNSALSAILKLTNPYPNCANDCKVIKELGAGECKNVCPEKFKLTNLKPEDMEIEKPKKDYYYFLKTITHDDKELAKIQARAMEIGYTDAYYENKLTNLHNNLLPKVNGNYQCEHAKNNTLGSDCVWCNLTVAEKIIDRLKGELANLKPDNRPSVVFRKINGRYEECFIDNEDVFKGWTNLVSKPDLKPLNEDEIAQLLLRMYKHSATFAQMAKEICSHFSKPQGIKYPEKKEVVDIRKKMCFDDFQHPTECLYDLPYDKNDTCRLQDKGIPKEQCKEYKDMIIEHEDFTQYNQAISDMRKLNGEGGV